MIMIFAIRKIQGFAYAAEFSSIFFVLLILNCDFVLTRGAEISTGLREASMVSSIDKLQFVLSRRLLDELPGRSSSGAVVAEPERAGEGGCTKDDILVHQEATDPMPDGIPTYTVNVLSTCGERSGCWMGQVHMACGWFSTAREINPSVLRRLRFNDCLLNGGRSLPPGSILSFQYANTFPYPFAVSAAQCLPVHR